MSTLWTPEGEHPVGRERSSTAGAGETPADGRSGGARTAAGDIHDASELSDTEREEVAAHLKELRDQILSAPPEVVIANHAYGLFELAAIHLSEKPPRLDAARLAIDAMASLTEGLAGRLGEAERSLNDALSQIRLAFVQIGGGPAAESSDKIGTEPSGPGD